MRKGTLVLLMLMVLAFGLVACSCSSLSPSTHDDVVAEVSTELPQAVDQEILASKITDALLGGLAEASKDGTVTILEIVDAAFCALEAGLRYGQVWDRRVSTKDPMTVGDYSALARQTTTTALKKSNLSALVLYDDSSDAGELTNQLTAAMNNMVHKSFLKGHVTIGDVVGWPLALGMLALDESGVADRVVGTVSGATAPTTIGSLYLLGLNLTESTLQSLRLWDVLLWRTV